MRQDSLILCDLARQSAPIIFRMNIEYPNKKRMSDSI